MKIQSTFLHKAVLVGATLAGLAFGTVLASAHDGQWDHRHHYYRDNYGYWDNHDRYHHYVLWHQHHGYWDTRGGGPRIFINVD